MFGFLKNLLPKQSKTPVEYPDVTEAAPAPTPKRKTYAVPNRALANPNADVISNQTGKMIELPLQAILSNLPLELQPRLLQTEVGDATIEVLLEKILSQLSRGTVRISFGELRQAAPDVFSPENDRDRVLVPLPLGEILSRLNPSLIVRRRVQKHVEVPEHISSPFDPNGQGLVFSVGPASPEPAAPLPARPPRSPGTPLRVTLPQSRGNMTSAPTPPAPAATVPSAPARSPTPASRAPRDTEIIPAPVPIPMSRPTIPLSAPAPSSATAPFVVPLTALAEGWPEAVRKEIVQLELVEAKVSLPTE